MTGASPDQATAGHAPGGRRILVVSNLFPPHVIGGAEIVAYRQARQLQSRGHIVSVLAGWVAPDGEAGRLAVEDDDGIRIWRTPVVSFDADDNFLAPGIAARLQAVLAAEQPDLVHFHNVAGFGFSLLPLVKRHDIPVVVTLHDHAGYCHRATALRPDGSLCQEPEECGLACAGAIHPRGVGIDLPIRLRRDYVGWALAHADRLISPSAALAESYRAAHAVEPSRLAVISNGIDLAPFARPADTDTDTDTDGGRLRFACVAYLGEHKGIVDLLRAADRLAATPELAGSWSLRIAGDGHLRPWVEAEIASGRFGDAVIYLGRLPRAEIVAELARTDVVVLPSRWPENEPVVLLEAIAAGVAQLATATGGMPELVRPGVTGELVPPGQPDALADAMAGYIRDPGRARRHGAANWARREGFSETASIDAVAALHDDALREAVGRAPRDPGAPRPLVLCVGDWPQPQVAAACNHLYRLEQPFPGIRLVWHDWVDAAAWEQASLLWNWSPGAHHTVIRRALRAGVPILAPRSCAPVAGLQSSFGVALTYDTFLEGMLALARLPHDAAALRGLRRHCREAAALLAASAPQARYDLAGLAVSA